MLPQTKCEKLKKETLQLLSVKAKENGKNGKRAQRKYHWRSCQVENGRRSTYVENKEVFKWQSHEMLENRVSHWESGGQEVNQF